MQGDNVTLVKASDKCPDLTNCTGLEVITGPRDLLDDKLWPSVDLAKLTAVPTAAPVTAVPSLAPVTTIDDKPTPVVSSSGSGSDVEMRKGEEGSSGGGSLWLLGLIALLVIAGGVYAAYSMGLFGDDYKEYDDEDSEDEEDPEGGQYEDGYDARRSPQE